MKALTIKAPWAQAIVYGTKRIENRTWKPHADVIGKRIAIHCELWDSENIQGLKGVREQIHLARAELEKTPRIPTQGRIIGSARVAGWFDPRKRYGEIHKPNSGAIIGLALSSIRGLALDPYWLGPIGWLLDDVRAVEPVAVRGQVGLWTVPNGIELIEIGGDQ